MKMQRVFYFRMKKKKYFKASQQLALQSFKEHIQFSIKFTRVLWPLNTTT